MNSVIIFLGKRKTTNSLDPSKLIFLLDNPQYRCDYEIKFLQSKYFEVNLMSGYELNKIIKFKTKQDKKPEELVSKSLINILFMIGAVLVMSLALYFLLPAP